jgi:hypothetical protein
MDVAESRNSTQINESVALGVGGLRYWARRYSQAFRRQQQTDNKSDIVSGAEISVCNVGTQTLSPPSVATNDRSRVGKEHPDAATQQR